MLKVKKLLINKKLWKLLMSTLLLLQKMLKDRVKIILYNNSHTHFMEQAFTNPYPSMEWKCTTTEEI